MEIKSKNNIISWLSSCHIRPSFCELLKIVIEYTEANYVRCEESGQINPFVMDICKIITEVFFLNPDKEMKIGGEELPVGLVQEIYSQLTSEHLENVIDGFNNISNKVINKRSYLRTSLYNSYFELEADTNNTYNRYH